MVRSRMRLRSNSARAPKMWKISLPPGCGRVDLFCQGFERHPSRFELGDRLDQVRQCAAESIESPHDECVTRSQCVHDGSQLRTIRLRS